MIFFMYSSSSPWNVVLIGGVIPWHDVHSLLTFLKELHQAFNECDHQDVYESISHLRMKPSEIVEEFSTRFLHLCHEIRERFVDLDFMRQELKRLVHVS